MPEYFNCKAKDHNCSNRFQNVQVRTHEQDSTTPM